MAGTTPADGLVLHYDCDAIDSSGPLFTIEDTGPDGHTGYCNPVLCSAPKYVDGVAQIWLGDGATGNRVHGNALGPVEHGLATVVCGGECNELDGDTYSTPSDSQLLWWMTHTSSSNVVADPVVTGVDPRDYWQDDGTNNHLVTGDPDPREQGWACYE